MREEAEALGSSKGASHSHHSVLAEFQGRQRGGKLRRGKAMAPVVPWLPWLAAVGGESWRPADQKRGHLNDCRRVGFLSVVLNGGGARIKSGDAAKY